MADSTKDGDGVERVDLDDLYQRFSIAFKSLYAVKNGKKGNVQSEGNAIWNPAKKRFGKDKKGLKDFIETKILEYKVDLEKEKMTSQKVKFQSYFKTTVSTKGGSHAALPEKQSSIDDNIPGSYPRDSQCLMVEIVEPENSAKNRESMPIPHSDNNQSATKKNQSKGSKRSYPTPAQDELKEEIEFLEHQLTGQLLARKANRGGKVSKSDIEETEMKLEIARKKLSSKQQNADYQKKFRNKEKEKKSKNVSEIAPPKQVGRPPLIIKQPDLIKTIVDLASFGAPAEGRRQTEETGCGRTLADLHLKLNDLGFEISKSGTYLYLLPRRSNTNEGRKHKLAAPVRLCKADNSAHKSHPDSKFCTTSIRYLESLASLLGPDQVVFVSQDDKARVHIGIRAAQKQSPILMSLQYRVTLPDHDFVVAERHKLIPSVYAAICIKSNQLGQPEAVTYSGSTYIAIRSGKHDSSTAATHAVDLRRFLDLPELEGFAKCDEQVKPILMITSDGGPDENPRYPKVISEAIKHFKSLNLDALYIATNAPGRSCFNRVERRMAPLSGALAGLILPHDYYGTHLDGNGKTIDEKLELKNFQKAGETLAEIWGKLQIDGHPVRAEFIEPLVNLNSTKIDVVDADWYATHVRESQYFLQIVKCQNADCCGKLRSDLHSILPGGFFPAPIRVKQNDGKLKISSVNDPSPEARFLPLSQRLSLTSLVNMQLQQFTTIPYDYFCPTIHGQIEGRTCKTCGLYFASKRAADSHKKSLNHKVTPHRKNNGKIELKKIIARRDDEVLCTFKDKDHVVENVEWVPIVEIEPKLLADEQLSAGSASDTSFHVIESLEKWIQDSYCDE